MAQHINPDWFAPPEGERILDSFTPMGAGLPAPLVYDIAEPALRLREVSFAAKRLVDMAHGSGLPFAEALRRLIWRGIAAPAGLQSSADSSARLAQLRDAVEHARVIVQHDEAAQRVAVTWTDPALGPPITGSAIAPPGWGGIVLGAATQPRFTPAPIPRRAAEPDRAWPLGNGVEPPAPADAKLQDAVATFFARSAGAYSILVASPEQILFEQYEHGGAIDRPTPSWSMNKSFTGTLIGRMLQLGWLDNVGQSALAPLWRDPRGIHALITLDDLLRMRSGLGLALADGTLGFENAAVYFDAGDAFALAQRNIVATRPGSVFRYINAGINVLGAIIRDRIERRGLPYPQTVYALLADRLGMPSYMCSADIAGNLIASGAAFGTLRDYAKLAVLYINDGIWDGERLLPEGWVDYALTPSHATASYAGTFWTNSDRRFPALPPDAAWLSGASDQRVFILRKARRIVAVSNETEVKMDLSALNDVLAVVLAG
jgi:CubicO group peptidase (beta-lactamase class C family)